MGYPITNNGGPGGPSSSSALSGPGAAVGTRNRGNVNGVPVDEVLASVLSGQDGDSPLTPPQQDALTRAGWKAMDDIALDTSFYTVTALVLEGLQKAKEAENLYRSERSRAAVADERAAEKQQRKAADDKRLSGFVAAGAEAAQGAVGIYSGSKSAKGGYKSAQAMKTRQQLMAESHTLRTSQEDYAQAKLKVRQKRDEVAMLEQADIRRIEAARPNTPADDARHASLEEADRPLEDPIDGDGPELTKARKDLRDAMAERDRCETVCDRRNEITEELDQCEVDKQEGSTEQDKWTARGRGIDSLLSAIGKGFTSQIDHEQELAQIEATSLHTSADEKREEARKSESTVDGLKQAWEATRGTVEAVMRSNAETNRILIS